MQARLTPLHAHFACESPTHGRHKNKAIHMLASTQISRSKHDLVHRLENLKNPEPSQLADLFAPRGLGTRCLPKLHIHSQTHSHPCYLGHQPRGLLTHAGGGERARVRSTAPKAGHSRHAPALVCACTRPLSEYHNVRSINTQGRTV
jgi:hypothetical protein